MDAITIGVGSAGTVTGVGETIKAWTNDVRIVAVEPYENQVLGVLNAKEFLLSWPPRTERELPRSCARPI